MLFSAVHGRREGDDRREVWSKGGAPAVVAPVALLHAVGQLSVSLALPYMSYTPAERPFTASIAVPKLPHWPFSQPEHQQCLRSTLRTARANHDLSGPLPNNQSIKSVRGNPQPTRPPHATTPQVRVSAPSVRVALGSAPAAPPVRGPEPRAFSPTQAC